jgi:RNA-directed DNA polymerase
VSEQKQPNIEKSTIAVEIGVHTRREQNGLGSSPASDQEQTPQPKSKITLEEILSKENMLKALVRVEQNKGAPGIDGMETSTLRGFLHKEWNSVKTQLLDGRYRPSPARRVEIPKPNGGTRMLGIPTVTDRLIQQAIAQKLSPIFDNFFSDHSYGFRPNRSAHRAIEKAKQFVDDGKRYVVDIDLEKFFDRVNHDILMSRIARKIEDKATLRLIRAYLGSGVMVDGISCASTEGTPQGSPLSPLLSNIMLDDLDKEIEQRGISFVRYADDCNLYVRTKRAGLRVFASIKRFIEERLKLRVNEKKSAVATVSRRKFLGYRFLAFKKVKISLAPESVKRFKNKVREITRGHRRENMELRIKKLTWLMRGWMNYFHLIETPSTIRDLDSWIRHRLRMCLLKLWWRPLTRVRMLLRHGMYRSQAKIYAQKGRHWFLSDTKFMNAIFSTKFWKEKGLVSLTDTYTRARQELQTAVYGSVRTVV